MFLNFFFCSAAGSNLSNSVSFMFTLPFHFYYFFQSRILLFLLIDSLALLVTNTQIVRKGRKVSAERGPILFFFFSI